MPALAEVDGARRSIKRGMDLADPDETTMVQVAADDVRRRFPSVAAPHIDETVRTCVRDWTGRARVKTFVPIFAARSARAVIEQELATGTRDRTDGI